MESLLSNSARNGERMFIETGYKEIIFHRFIDYINLLSINSEFYIAIRSVFYFFWWEKR